MGQLKNNSIRSGCAECRIKRLSKPGMGFYSFHTARRMLAGFEVMNRIRKGQVDGVARADVIALRDFLNHIFGIAA